MHPKRFAFLSGILFFAVGMLSLLPALNSIPSFSFPLRLNVSYGAFLGIFPLNILSKFCLALVGAYGVLSATAPTTALPRSIYYARRVSAGMGLATFLGVIPFTNTLFGYCPLYGATCGATAILCLVSA